MFSGYGTQILKGKTMTHFEAASLALQETTNAQTFWIGIGQIAVIFLGLAVMRWESSPVPESMPKP